jgi:ribonuclease-3
MTQEDIREVESSINYCFKNSALLKQAFTRKTYSEENGGQDNEVLEFLGDEVLGYVVTKKLCSWYRTENPAGNYESEMNEAQLTEVRKQLVCKQMLSERIDILGFASYLIMGEGDSKNHAEEDVSVKEDLFEAILGAVAVDSGYDSRILEEVVRQTLDPEYYLRNGFDANSNSVSQLQEWFTRKGYGLPDYRYWENGILVAGNAQGCSLLVPGLDQPFSAMGTSKAKSRQAVADAVLDYLDENGMLADPNDVVKNPSEQNAISQLNQLYQHGFISEPEYIDEERRDKNGAIVWYCELHVKELPNFWYGTYSSKKEAHRSLAYQTLLDVLGKTDQE